MRPGLLTNCVLAIVYPKCDDRTIFFMQLEPKLIAVANKYGTHLKHLCPASSPVATLQRASGNPQTSKTATTIDPHGDSEYPSVGHIIQFTICVFYVQGDWFHA